VLAKCRCEFTSFPAGSAVSRPPYYPVERAAIEQVRSDFESFWAEELSEHRRRRELQD
jgi:hypothetical protein